MKKYLSIVIITLLSLGIVSNAIAATYSQKSNYEIIAFVYQSDLQATTKGKEYLAVANAVIKKYTNNTAMLLSLRDSTNKVLVSNTIKDDTLNSFFAYLNAKTNALLTNEPTSTVSNTGSTTSPITSTNNSNEESTSINNNDRDGKTIVTLITDKRDPNSDTDSKIKELKALPSLKDAIFESVNFSDDGIREFLELNNIKYLPTIIFNTNKIDTSKDPEKIDYDGYILNKIDAYLVELPSGDYEYSINGKFNPFTTIDTTAGKTYLSQATLDKIKESSYYKGDLNSKFTWIEYSDIQCPYCRSLHTDSIYNDVQSQNRNIIYYFQHYPLQSHANAEIGAEILECLGEQKGGSAFYSLIDRTFYQGNSEKSYLIQEAIRLGADQNKLEICINEGKYKDKVKEQMQLGYDYFDVVGTPTVILINNFTLEYKKVTGTYPVRYYLDLLYEIN